MATAAKIKRTIEFTLPTIVGIKEFKPTRLMLETIAIHIVERARKEKLRSIPQILVEGGHDRQNWYQWLQKPGFQDWWSKTIVEQFHTKTGLLQVYDAVHRRACGNSPQDAKTFLERFDDEYKPHTAQEHKFPGIVPKSEDELREAEELRKRRMAEIEAETKQIESKVVNEAPVDSNTHNDEQDAG